MLQTVWVTPDQEKFGQITQLLSTIFPKEELPPSNIIDNVVPYLCFYDDGAFIGFAQVLKKPDLHYLSYMAILEEYRSRGYGGKMLELILKERGNVPLVLDIEPVDSNAPNSEQRIRRLHFYLKHGLVDSGYVLFFRQNPFTVMSTGEKEAPELFKKYCEGDLRYAPGILRIVKKEA